MTRDSRYALYGCSGPNEEFRKVVTSLLLENGQLASLQCMCNGGSCGMLLKKISGAYSTHSGWRIGSCLTKVWTAKSMEIRREEKEGVLVTNNKD